MVLESVLILVQNSSYLRSFDFEIVTKAVNLMMYYIISM